MKQTSGGKSGRMVTHPTPNSHQDLAGEKRTSERTRWSQHCLSPTAHTNKRLGRRGPLPYNTHHNNHHFGRFLTISPTEVNLSLLGCLSRAVGIWKQMFKQQILTKCIKQILKQTRRPFQMQNDLYLCLTLFPNSPSSWKICDWETRQILIQTIRITTFTLWWTKGANSSSSWTIRWKCFVASFLLFESWGCYFACLSLSPTHFSAQASSLQLLRDKVHVNTWKSCQICFWVHTEYLGGVVWCSYVYCSYSFSPSRVLLKHHTTIWEK